MKLSKGQEKNIVYSLLINYAIYILMRLFFYPTYESQLDEMMQAAICGVSGTRTAYILYTNVFIGWILKYLTIAIPAINWYFAYLCGLVIIGLSLICYFIMKRTNQKIGLAVSVILASFVGYECYVLPGYMKTASVIGIAMLVVMADYIEEGRRKNRKKEFLIVLLAVLSSMISFHIFVITTILGTVSMLAYYGIRNVEKIRLWVSKKHHLNKHIEKHFVIFLSGIFCAVILVQALDCFSYQLSGQTNALKYRSAVVRMYGYGMGEYEESYAEDYGIDSAEYATIKKGSFGVIGESTWEKLDGLSKEKKEMSGTVLSTYFRTVPRMLFKYGMWYLFIVMMLTLLFSTIKEKRILVWTEIGLLFFSFFVAYLCNAWQDNWMVFVIIFPLLIPLFFALEGAEEKDYQYLWVYMIILSVVLYSKFSSGMISSVSEGSMEKQFLGLDANCVNVIDINAYFKSYSAQQMYPADVLKYESIRISNGAYALMEGFEEDVITGYPSGKERYEWIYNPKEISVYDLIFED